MRVHSTILLIGLRGSGKSTLGAPLASELGVPFTDLDALTLELLGFETVAAAWEARGEPAFREAETEVLRRSIEHAEGRGGVIALGGGTPTAPGAAEIIRRAPATTIYLRGRPGLLRSRMFGSDDPNRPSLTGEDPTDEIKRVFNDRDAKYVSIADHTIELSAQEQPDATLQRCLGLIG